MALFSGFISLGIAIIFQTTMAVNIQLLEGTVDLVFLALLGWLLQEGTTGHIQWGMLAGVFVGVTSAIPIYVPLAGYLGITIIVIIIKQRIWQVQILLLLITTILGILIIQGLTYFYLLITGVPLDLLEVFNLIILPSIILNLLMALPIFGLMGEIAKWVYPSKVTI